jgi:hypothetical protein
VRDHDRVERVQARQRVERMADRRARLPLEREAIRMVVRPLRIVFAIVGQKQNARFHWAQGL